MSPSRVLGNSSPQSYRSDASSFDKFISISAGSEKLMGNSKHQEERFSTESCQEGNGSFQDSTDVMQTLSCSPSHLYHSPPESDENKRKGNLQSLNTGHESNVVRKNSLVGLPKSDENKKKGNLESLNSGHKSKTPSPSEYQEVKDKISRQLKGTSVHCEQLYEQNECIKRMLRQVLTNQRRILSFVVPENEFTANDFENLPTFPFVSEEEFEEFEEYLLLKSQMREAVKFIISLYKENWDEKKFVGQVLRTLISNDLAGIISPSRLNHASRLAMVKLFSKCDIGAAEDRIKRWFSTSEQRKHD